MITRREAVTMQRPDKKAQEQYDLAEFARRYGLSAVKAKQILDQAGNDRKLADSLIATRRPPQD